jgi:hypothetical protein
MSRGGHFVISRPAEEEEDLEAKKKKNLLDQRPSAKIITRQKTFHGL